eukprot:c6982_g1_i1.p1 GENE.c6982_g1_i1~~c6982_g1_i1.p1  ORF type:complete len:151 (+),score=41.22 c6982_g1_i1:342-794(+)
MFSECPRVMSLRDGSVKMSKSDPSVASRIDITDTADEIATKIRRAKTDSINEIYYDPKERPEVANLLRMLSAISKKSTDALVAEFSGQNILQFKEALAQAMIEKLSPIRIEREKILETGYVDEVIVEGTARAREVAEETLVQVKRVVGLL